MNSSKVALNKTNKTNIQQGAYNPLPLVYPFRWQGLESFTYVRDSEGIPKVYVNSKAGLRYNPITIAQYGLFNLQNYSCSNEDKFLSVSEKSANWLFANFQDWNHNIGAWVYDFDLDFYGPEAPWISAMAQAQGISLLLRMGHVLGKTDFLEITHKAYAAFRYPVEKKGVCSNFPDGTVVFEEFPTQPPSLVLNGHIFALLGIFDYATFWNDHEAGDLFKTAVNGLKKNLHRYDTGYWNLYDLHPTRRLASPMYVKVHIRLLRILTDLSGESYFQEISNKWQKYLIKPHCRAQWLARKILEKIRFGF